MKNILWREIAVSIAGVIIVISAILTVRLKNNSSTHLTRMCIPEGGQYGAPGSSTDFCCDGLIREADPSSMSGTWGICVSPVNARQPSVVRVFSPNGGEVYKAGDTMNILWIATSTDVVALSLSTPNGQLAPRGTGGMIIDVLAPNTGQYSWVIPSDLKPGSYKITVITPSTQSGFMGGTDLSDNTFTIIEAQKSQDQSSQTIDWKTYTDNDFGFAFYYPISWKVSTTSDGVNIIGFGSTMNDQYPDIISIKEVSGPKVTVQDAKFGDTTLYYDDNTNRWMEQLPNEYGDGVFTPVSPLKTVSGLPVFSSTGRLATNIVALSHTKFLVVNITGSGDIKPFGPFVHAITEPNANISTDDLSVIVKAEAIEDAFATGPQGVVVLNSLSPNSGPAGTHITLNGKGFMSLPMPALQETVAWKTNHHVQVTLVGYPANGLAKVGVLYSGNPTNDSSITFPIPSRICHYDIDLLGEKTCSIYTIITPGIYTITVSVQGQQQSNGLPFVVTGPPVSDIPIMKYLEPSSAQVGITVKIHGSNFTGNEGISIGDIPLFATPSHVSPDGTELDFVVPEHGTYDKHIPGSTYSLNLSGSNGRTISNSLDFTLAN